jgi:hypothetical protein
MKKLKFLALGLAGLMAFASCGKEDEKTAENYNQTQVTLGGHYSSNGSFYTFDKGVQKQTELGDVATNVIFCFSSAVPTGEVDENGKKIWEKIDPVQIISGTEAGNDIVKAQASETKFAKIKEATADAYEKATAADFNMTVVEFDRKVTKGKTTIAFKNDKCEGFFEVVSFSEDTDDVTLNIWTKK